MPTYDFYTNTYGGDLFTSQAEFLQYAKRAYFLLNVYAGFKLDTVSAPSLVEKINYAACVQAEFLLLNGLDITSIGVTEGGFSVGKVHVNGGSASAKNAWYSYLAPLALDLLAQAGISRHLAVAVEPFAPYWG